MRILVLIALSAILNVGTSFGIESSTEVEILCYTVDPAKADLRLYWKDNKGKVFGSLGNLRDWMKKNKKQLLFAMNGGMYQRDNSPLGLFIQEERVIKPINTASGSGNFYLKPNGVFYIDKARRAFVCKTEDFNGRNVSYATQSGPMLLMDSMIHPEFKKGSSNLNIRNAVGILPDSKVIFAMSTKPVSLYEFADWFRKQGCRNALYLDGAVSKTYLPEKNWMDIDGNFGVIIAVSKDIK